MQRLLPIIPVISLQIILEEEKKCVLFSPPSPTPFDERPKFDLLFKLSRTHFASRSVQTCNFLPLPLPWEKKPNNFKSEPHLPIYASILNCQARWNSHVIIPPIVCVESNALMSYFPQERVTCSHVSDRPVALHLNFPCLMCSAWIFV